MDRSAKRIPYLFLAPYLILFLMFFIVPFLYAAYLSTFVTHAGTRVFVGLQNYSIALNDTAFWSGVERVAYYAVVQVCLMVFFALGLSLFIDSPYVKSKSLFRLIYFLPYAVPSVVAALMWGFLYTPALDPLLKIAGHTINVLTLNNVLYGIINIALWSWVGFNMTIYYANLTSIPIELYDAAKIDGCNEWQTAIHIKVPMIRSTIVFTLVLNMIGALQLFNEPFIINKLMSLPPSFTPNMYIYNMAFAFNNMTYAATLSVILTVITVIACVFFLILTSEQKSPVNTK